MATAPEPGVYPGISFDDYARWDAINHSVLRHFRKTPAHAYWEWTHQKESTTFQDLGHLIHFAVLEPERFAKEGPVVAPDVDRRTTLGKATWAEFVAANEGRAIVTEEDMRTLRGIQDSVMRHATAREALYGVGASELSLVWDDRETGVTCKGRLDRAAEIGGWPCIVDLKTTSKPATTHTFQNSVESYGYHEQAALYLRGAATLIPPDEGVTRKFIWLVAETEPPYCVRMFECDDAALDIGQKSIDDYLARFAACRESGAWGGWPDGVDLAGLPPWAYKRYDVE